ncbi:MAG: undecaprenyl/decaprenyl-phosphate alpha-N-acetylglucosaminyl 1-phosphate transferase [Bacteroidales bacterium]|nr:undecaprenyl/decaprenyl-phosphate alpha-N-acetylglucosaminyl 1-phosphate transferase [Bacteroidales bacterium]
MIVPEVTQDTPIAVIEGFFVAFIITYTSIPSILDVARLKNLYDVPNGRTSHHKTTPTLGGIAIFAGFIISSMIFLDIPKIPYFQFAMASAVIIFFLGLKDDISALSPLKKFIGEIIAAGIIIDLGGIRITTLHGFLGVYTLNPTFSDFLSLFVVVAIINAFNLIDGIDGLSSGVGILASIAFGTWFYLTGHIELAAMAAILVGALLAFFRFNFFSEVNKIFMGDIGSLLLGFILSIFAIEFNEISAAMNPSNVYFIKAAPSVSIGILIIPIFDTVRVMMVRMMKGGSPFKPDKRHIHHYLLEIMGNHHSATSILLAFNLGFILLSFWLRNLNIGIHILVLIVLAGTLSFIPYYIVRRRHKNNIVGRYSANID